MMVIGIKLIVSGLVGGFGRRLAGGLFQQWSGLDWGQPVRLFFGFTCSFAGWLAGAGWMEALALAPLVWVGTTLGLFGGLGMGRGSQGYWRDFGTMTLHGVLSVILPCAWAVWLGYAWWPIALSGLLIGVAYEAGYRLIGLNPQPYPFNRISWPAGFNGAPEWGELIWGAVRGVGVALAVLI